MEKGRIAWGTAAASLAFALVTNADRIAKFFGIVNIPKDARELMVSLSQVPTILSWAIFVMGLAALAYLYSEQLSAVTAPVARFFRQWEVRAPLIRNSSSVTTEHREFAPLTEPHVPQRRLSQYEIDEKLKALAKILQFLREEVRHVTNQWQELDEAAWPVFQDRERNAWYQKALEAYVSLVRDTMAKLEAMLKQTMEYPDIAAAAKPVYRVAVETAATDFKRQFHVVMSYALPHTPNDHFWNLMAPTRPNIHQAISHLRVAVDKAESELVELRKTLTK